MTKKSARKEKMPSEALADYQAVQPMSEDERIERGDQLIRQLKKAQQKSGVDRWVQAQILHELSANDLWVGFADTWAEFVESIGLSKTTVYFRRKNYEFYIGEMGMDMSDERLQTANESKLFLANRSQFRAWVRENIDEFLDYCYLPLGEGGMQRSDLLKYLEEVSGIESDDDSATMKRALNGFRKGIYEYNQMSEDDWMLFIETVRNDDDLLRVIGTIVDAARSAVEPRADYSEEDTEFSLLEEDEE